MLISRFLAGAVLATTAFAAQAAIDIVVDILPTHFEPDHLAIPPQEAVPAAFSLSFTLDTHAPSNVILDDRSATMDFALHTDPRSPVHDRLSKMSSIWFRSHMLQDGTASFTHKLLSGVAPSSTSLVLSTADASQMPDMPLSAYDYSRTVTLSRHDSIGAPASSELLAPDEAAIASWLTSQIGHNFERAYEEALQRPLEEGQIFQRSLFGDVVIKSVTVVPEPSTMTLGLVGALGFVALRGSRRRKTVATQHRI